MRNRGVKEARPVYRVYSASGVYLGSVRAADAWAAVAAWNRDHEDDELHASTAG